MPPQGAVRFEGVSSGSTQRQLLTRLSLLIEKKERAPERRDLPMMGAMLLRGA
jgi:hypothetical protein